MPDLTKTAFPMFDVHSHTQLPAWEEGMKKAGLALRGWSLDEILETMDRQGVATTVFSQAMPISFAGKDEPALARRINEGHAELKARFPGKFGAYAVLPGRGEKASIDEMIYALDELGLDGVCTNTNLAGSYLGDPIYDEWFAEMNRRGCPLFVHPNYSPASVDLGWHVSILEFMFEITRMVTNLVFTGTKQKFPNVKIIVTHGGGTIPYLAQRLSWLQSQYGAGPGRRTLSKEEVMDGLRSFYYDLTAATTPAQLDGLLHLVPHTQLLVGLDMPYMDLAFVEPAKKQFLAYEHLTDSQKRDICSTNAAALFPKLWEKAAPSFA